jgi:hypothetical protein
VVDVYKKIIDACPYCGAMEMGMHIGKSEKAYRVACLSCSATGPIHKDISTAVFLWNTVSRSWFNQSLTTHIPPAMEVSHETCDQLRRENDLLQEMISDRLGSQWELEREANAGDFHDLDSVGCGGDPLGWLKKKELGREGDPGELGREGDPGELQRGGDPGELEREGAPGELGRTVAPKKTRSRRRRRRGKRDRGVSLETIIMATALKGILSIMLKK